MQYVLIGLAFILVITVALCAFLWGVREGYLTWMILDQREHSTESYKKSIRKKLKACALIAFLSLVVSVWLYLKGVFYLDILFGLAFIVLFLAYLLGDTYEDYLQMKAIDSYYHEKRLMFLRQVTHLFVLLSFFVPFYFWIFG